MEQGQDVDRLVGADAQDVAAIVVVQFPGPVEEAGRPCGQLEVGAAGGFAVRAAHRVVGGDGGANRECAAGRQRLGGVGRGQGVVAGQAPGVVRDGPAVGQGLGGGAAGQAAADGGSENPDEAVMGEAVHGTGRSWREGAP